MDVSLSNILNDIDRKVIIREIKEKGKNKTIITNITDYDEFKNENYLKDFIKEIKTKYGCGTVLIDGKIVIQGYHKNNTSEMLRKKIKGINID